MMRNVVACLLLTALCVGGCARSLPTFGEEMLNSPCPIPRGAAPVFFWNGQADGLLTYWYKQDITIQAAAYVPPQWKQVGDECWLVHAWNREGARLPFLGVIHQFDENGVSSAVLVPETDVQRLPDGLYVTIIPDIDKTEHGLASIKPIAVIHEVRDHSFQAFRIRVPLTPEQNSPLTPAPEIESIPRPRGTPIAVYE